MRFWWVGRDAACCLLIRGPFASLLCGSLVYVIPSPASEKERDGTLGCRCKSNREILRTKMGNYLTGMDSLLEYIYILFPLLSKSPRNSMCLVCFVNDRELIFTIAIFFSFAFLLFFYFVIFRFSFFWLFFFSLFLFFFLSPIYFLFRPTKIIHLLVSDSGLLTRNLILQLKMNPTKGLIGLLSSAGDAAGPHHGHPRHLPPLGDLVSLGLVNPSSWFCSSGSSSLFSFLPKHQKILSFYKTTFWLLF